MLSVAERTATLQPPKSKTQKGPGGEGRKSYFRHPQFSGAANNQDPFRVAENTPHGSPTASLSDPTGSHDRAYRHYVGKEQPDFFRRVCPSPNTLKLSVL